MRPRPPQKIVFIITVHVKRMIDSVSRLNENGLSQNGLSKNGLSQNGYGCRDFGMVM